MSKNGNNSVKNTVFLRTKTFSPQESLCTQGKGHADGSGVTPGSVHYPIPGILWEGDNDVFFFVIA